MNIDENVCNDLFYYTLAHGGPSFIHQHAVDAIAAQSATADNKPIKLTFALVGLYLHVEHQFTGQQVQAAHIKLGRQKQAWPVFSLPETRGPVTIDDVLAAPAGAERDTMIHRWCESLWEAFADNRTTVVELLEEQNIV